MNPSDVIRHVTKYIPEVRDAQFRIDGKTGHFVCTIDGRMVCSPVPFSAGASAIAVGNDIVHQLRSRVAVKA